MKHKCLLCDPEFHATLEVSILFLIALIMVGLFT